LGYQTSTLELPLEEGSNLSNIYYMPRMMHVTSSATAMKITIMSKSSKKLNTCASCRLPNTYTDRHHLCMGVAWHWLVSLGTSSMSGRPVKVATIESLCNRHFEELRTDGGMKDGCLWSHFNVEGMESWLYQGGRPAPVAYLAPALSDSASI
jgi:hypothetical protein